MTMAEKDDGLGLSLSLRIRSENHNPNLPPAPAAVAAAAPFPLNLFGSPLPFIQHQQKITSTIDAFQSTSHARDEENRSVLFRGIDMNRPENAVLNGEKEAMVSSPNSTVSSVSGKRSEREENDEDDGEMDDEDGGDAAARKKLRLCKEQATVLEETFREHNTLNPKQKMALAKQLNLSPRQVEVWFQNRRARTKLKQTEVDCEYLRRYYDNLTDENKRLQKEVNELRALKRSPQFYMNICPPTTLTMCPQCERVAAVSSSSLSSSATAASTTSGGAAICRLPLGHHRQPAVPWGANVPPQKIDAHRRPVS